MNIIGVCISQELSLFHQQFLQVHNFLPTVILLRLYVFQALRELFDVALIIWKVEEVLHELSSVDIFSLLFALRVR